LRALTLLAAIMAALLLSFSGPIAGEPTLSQRVTARLGLEALYTQFGETVALSAERGGIGDRRFRAAWEAVVRDAFAPGALSAALVTELDAALAPDEMAAIEAFFASELGQRIGMLEGAVQQVPADAQIDLVAKGHVLLFRASPGRQAQIGEVLELGSAEVTIGMLKESLRGMALGLHLSKNDGLTVPWEEIDAAVGRELAGMEESLRDASLGTLAYALSPLSDEELASYLDFLRAPGTQKFQALTALTIGRAIHDAMGTLGTGVAARLSAVAI
jgi:hypothetical protein